MTRGLTAAVTVAIGSLCSGWLLSAAAQPNPTIRIANLEIGPFVSVAYVAKLAQKHGITVKIVNFRRGLEAAQALKAGEADAAVGGIEAAVAAVAGGAQALTVTSVSTGGIAWVARADLPLKKLSDLKGRKFASIRGLHELVMLVTFEMNGLKVSSQPDPNAVHVVFINSPPALNTTLRTKEADAMTNAEPFPSRAVVEGYAKPFYKPYDTPLGKLPRAVFMSRDFVTKNRETAQRFVDAVVEATKTLRDDPKLARNFAVNEALKGAITAEDWDLSMKNLAFDVDLTVAGVQAYADYMLKYGMIKQRLNAADFTDLSMLAKAKAKARW